jgi:hypothetical protein
MARPDVEQRSSGGVRLRLVVHQIRSGEMEQSIRLWGVRGSVEKPIPQLDSRWGYRLMARGRLRRLWTGCYRRSNARWARFCGSGLDLSALHMNTGDIGDSPRDWRDIAVDFDVFNWISSYSQSGLW